MPAPEDKEFNPMSPHSLVVMQKTWNRYVENDVLDVQQLRPEVANSWQRCRNPNINPFHEADDYVNHLE